MNIEKLSQRLVLLANVGVLVGLIFLVYELQLSNRIAITTTELEIRNQMGLVQSALYSDEEISEIGQKVFLGSAEFNDLETGRFISWLTQLVNIWMSIETAYENGIVPEETYGVMFDSMDLMLSVPFGQDQLRAIHTQWPSLAGTVAFQYIDDQLSQIGK